MKNKNGFNLMIMSVIIMMLGIVMSSVLSFYKVNNIKVRFRNDQDKLNKIEIALKKYLIENKSFPCPSPLNCNIKGCVSAGDKIGVAKINSSNKCDYDNKGVFLSKNSNGEKILYGAIPIKNLNLTNDYLADSYGNKIVYIAFEKLTNKDNFITLSEDISNKINEKEYIKDGILYILMMFNNHSNGAYTYDNKKVNYFTGKVNMPIENFTIDINDKKFLYSYKTYRNLDLGNLESVIMECPEITIAFNGIHSFTFPQAKYGEIVFSKELCPNYVTYPVQENNYYYLSSYRNFNDEIMDNRAALKCGKNGKWEETFIYECRELDKCPKPSDSYPEKIWTRTDFEVVNTGLAQDDMETIKLKCLYKDGRMNWIEVE